MKKRFALILSLVMTVGILGGCSNATTQGSGTNAATAKTTSTNLKNVKIGLSMLTLSESPYYEAQVQAVKDEAKKYNATVYVTDAKNDINKQQADVEDLISKGVTALIMNPQDPIASVSSTKACKAANIPVFIIDSGIDDSAYYVTKIQSDSEQNGMLLGQWIVKTMGKKEMNIGWLSGSQGSATGTARRLSTIKGIADAQLTANGKTSFNIGTQGWGKWNTQDGLKAAEDMLQADPNINIFIAENDAMELGAMQAIKEVGKTKQIVVCAASDGQKQAYQAIMAGTYGATCLNDPNLLGIDAVDLAIKYLQGDRSMPKILTTKAAVITKDNVSQFYKANSIF